MRAEAYDRARLEAEIRRLVDQLAGLGAMKVVVFGSLARGEFFLLFSDIDLLALSDDARPPRELTKWVYKNIESGEGGDILSYGTAAYPKHPAGPFCDRS